jgi:large subunit ribosomal protein L35
MPKMKVHKGLSKRVKVTANKKLKIKKANGSHLMSGMSPKRRRKLGKPAFVDESIAKNCRKALCVE